MSFSENGYDFADMTTLCFANPPYAESGVVSSGVGKILFPRHPHCFAWDKEPGDSPDIRVVYSFNL